MQKVEHLQAFDQIKFLAGSRRMAILQILKGLKKAGLLPDAFLDYERTDKTHNEAAFQIENGKAAAALGLLAAADQHGFVFIPLFEERYDLVLPREQERVLTLLLDYLQTVDFHRGEQIPL